MFCSCAIWSLSFASRDLVSSRLALMASTWEVIESNLAPFAARPRSRSFCVDFLRSSTSACIAITLSFVCSRSVRRTAVCVSTVF